MGEWSQFRPGDRAPNDGEYMEVGENAFHMGINNPKMITLKKGNASPKPPIITESGKKSVSGLTPSPRPPRNRKARRGTNNFM